MSDVEPDIKPDINELKAKNNQTTLQETVKYTSDQTKKCKAELEEAEMEQAKLESKSSKNTEMIEDFVNKKREKDRKISELQNEKRDLDRKISMLQNENVLINHKLVQQRVEVSNKKAAWATALEYENQVKAALKTHNTKMARDGIDDGVVDVDSAVQVGSPAFERISDVHAAIGMTKLSQFRGKCYFANSLANSQCITSYLLIFFFLSSRQGGSQGS